MPAPASEGTDGRPGACRVGQGAGENEPSRIGRDQFPGPGGDGGGGGLGLSNPGRAAADALRGKRQSQSLGLEKLFVTCSKFMLQPGQSRPVTMCWEVEATVSMLKRPGR